MERIGLLDFSILASRKELQILGRDEKRKKITREPEFGVLWKKKVHKNNNVPTDSRNMNTSLKGGGARTSWNVFENSSNGFVYWEFQFTGFQLLI